MVRVYDCEGIDENEVNNIKFTDFDWQWESSRAQEIPNDESESFKSIQQTFRCSSSKTSLKKWGKN